MQITILSSGSSGNCAIVQNRNGRKLMIDCGLKYKYITTHDNFGSFHDYDCLLITHSHKDHNLSRNEFERSGLRVISTDNATANKVMRIGEWEILPFVVEHDTACYGYLIRTDGKTLWWGTDFNAMSRYLYGADIYAIEVNYCEEVVDKYFDRPTDEIDFNHLYKTTQTHFSLEQAEEFFQRGEASGFAKPTAILALHNSREFSDKQMIGQRLRQYADKVDVAEKDTILLYL